MTENESRAAAGRVRHGQEAGCQIDEWDYRILAAAYLAELRGACEARAAVGCVTSRRVLTLLAELAAKDDLIRGLSARVESQSQLLSRRAEK